MPRQLETPTRDGHNLSPAWTAKGRTRTGRCHLEAHRECRLVVPHQNGPQLMIIEIGGPGSFLDEPVSRSMM